jgi:hypothetical protein
MNYERIYNEFIADRKAKEPSYLRGLRYMSVRTKLRRMFGDKCGLETHHIVPVCEGGTDDPSNVVTLTVREHIFAHLLFAKANKGNAMAWASLWAAAGMVRKNRSAKTLLANKRAVATAREYMRSSCIGEKSKNANTTVYSWINYKTGEQFSGTRHDLVRKSGHTESAKWESGSYFYGRTLTTRSGWFETSRFSSVAALDAYKESIKDLAKAGTKAKNSGGMNHGARKVVCIDTGKVYDCQRDAATASGANQSKISECCTGSRKKAGGYRWAYADMKEAA